MHDPDVSADATSSAAVYSETATAYVDAIGTEISAAIDGAAELATLSDFADLVGADNGTVADVGCGPGRAAAHLASRGIDVVGFDIAQGMVDIARATHPHISFELGTLTALPVTDDAFAGVVCWYSIIHTPLAGLEPAWAELRRVLAPSAPLLLAFQAGDGERVERSQAAGTEHTLINHRHDPEQVAAALTRAGFEVESITQRPALNAHEHTPQAMVLARSAT